MSDNKVRILVTGSSGLVGSAIRKEYNENPSIQEKYEIIFVSSKDYNLLNIEETKRMFEDNSNIEIVIHLAACVGGLFKNLNNKVKMFEDNILMNYNVVKCCHDYNVKKFLGCLSTCVFPDKTTYPITEEFLHDNKPHESNYGYSHAKRMLDIHCKSYREQFGNDYFCIIPTNIYGEHDNFNLEDAHIIPALIHKCYIAKRDNTDFIVKGSGSPLRQFIFSHDLARMIFEILNKNINDNIILSIPEKDEITIKDVALIIAKCYDYNDRIVFDTNYSDGQHKKTTSNKKFESLVENFKYTDIENGIKDTVDWFIKNYDNARL